MRQYPYLFIAIALVGLLGAGTLAFSRTFHDVFEKSVTARIQAALLRTTVQVVEFQEYLGLRDQKIVAVGDIMLSRSVGKEMERRKDFAYPFRNIAEALRSADLAFGNLESPISARGKNQGSIYSFRADPKAIEGLVFAGFDVLSVANNHIWDWGSEALLDTRKILEAHSIKAAGAGKDIQEANAPVVFHLGKTKIAFFAYTNLYPKSLEAGEQWAGVSSFDLERIKQEIGALKSGGAADLIAVSIHWGEEYKTKANVEQKRIARTLVENGADLVIGHHPHVIQEIERYKSGWIAYSLGNFVFDQNFSKETRQGLLLEAIVRKGRISEVRAKKITISEGFQPSVEGQSSEKAPLN